EVDILREPALEGHVALFRHEDAHVDTGTRLTVEQAHEADVRVEVGRGDPDAPLRALQQAVDRAVTPACAHHTGVGQDLRLALEGVATQTFAQNGAGTLGQAQVVRARPHHVPAFHQLRHRLAGEAHTHFVPFQAFAPQVVAAEHGGFAVENPH